MAAAFGIAALVGVAAAREGSFASLALIAICLGALVVASPEALRLAVVAGLLGFVAGAVMAGLHGDATASEPTVLPELLEGRLASDPRLTQGGLYVELAWTEPSGRSRNLGLVMPPAAAAGRGDRVEVSLPEPGSSADLIVAERVEVISRAGRVERMRRSIRAYSAGAVLSQTPGSNGSLALGLLIGDDSGLTDAERDAMRASGLSHITAVSGSNVAMVIVVVAFVLRTVVRRSWLWAPPQLVAIALYVWIVGAEPPIVRAALMGCLVLLAIALGRPSHLFTLLCFSGGLMALLEPPVIASLSFQLSFLSMIALAIVGTRIQRIEGRGRRIVAAVASPVAAGVATAPLIAMRFGAFSLGTVPANIAVAPVIAPATALAALTACVAELPLLGAVCGILLWLATGIILEVAAFVGRFPGAYWTFAAPDPGTVVLVYLLLAALAAPCVPEARLAAHRLRGWAQQRPAFAISSASAGLALLWALAGLAN